MRRRTNESLVLYFKPVKGRELSSGLSGTEMRKDKNFIEQFQVDLTVGFHIVLVLVSKTFSAR